MAVTDYARHQFALDMVGANGSTHRDDLLSALRQAKTGWAGAPSVAAIEAELDGPSLPEDSAHLWAWFVELDRSRGSTGFGPAPIGWQDMAAWASLTGRWPMPWECQALMAVDRVFLEEWRKAQPKADAPAPGRPG